MTQYSGGGGDCADHKMRLLLHFLLQTFSAPQNYKARYVRGVRVATCVGIMSSGSYSRAELTKSRNVSVANLKFSHKTRARQFNHTNKIKDLNTFATSYLNTQGLNNSCLKSPASTLVDLTFQSRTLRSFSLNQLRNLSL